LRDRPVAQQRRPARGAIVTAIAVTFALAGMFIVLTTSGHEFLPVLMNGSNDVANKVVVALVTWVLCIVALLLLVRRRARSVLDLWLAVVMCTWIFDIALAAVL